MRDSFANFSLSFQIVRYWSEKIYFHKNQVFPFRLAECEKSCKPVRASELFEQICEHIQTIKLKPVNTGIL